MDAVLDRQLDEIVKELALPQDVRRALLGEPGPSNPLDSAPAKNRGYPEPGPGRKPVSDGSTLNLKLSTLNCFPEV